jgi:type I restriction enzyme S subunit
VIDWRGFIPPHWDIGRFRYLFRFGRGIDITKADLQDEGLPCVSYGEIHSRYGFEVSPETCALRCVDLENPEISQSSMLGKGDFVFADTSEDVEGSGNFTYLNSDSEVIAGYHTVIARPYERDASRFYAYLFDSIPFRAQIRSKVYGIKVFSITQAILKDARLPLPPKTEQQAIVRYLDPHITKIDEVLADLASQAEMLDTYKRELIAATVTKGLDKAAPMKDSGIEWIGEIPAHWEQYPLFAVAKENTIKNTGMAYDNLLSLSYGRIIQKDINMNFGLLPANFEGYQIVQPGYTVLRLTDLQNDKRSLRTGYVTETGIITSAYLGLIPSSRLDSKYFTYLLHAFDLLKIYYRLGGGIRQTLKFTDMKRLPVLIPSLPEQEQIVEFIDTKTVKVNELIADIDAQTEKLRQYRQIVIHDAVTGKIKVSEG